MTKIFIDGKAGTTGLRIYERLESRKDIEILTLSEEKRKDSEARKERLNTADIVFLCLPDDAAREAVSLITNPDVVVIDTSTAHRTEPGWIYGFPEVSDNIASELPKAKRIAVPGCHASGFIALVKPLIDNGYLPKNSKLSCFSITGYSGGGKKMIAQYDAPDRNVLLDAPRQYGLSQNHKHLKEMKAVCGLEYAPVFCPIVSDFYSGMEVTVPVFASDLLKGSVDEIKELYKNKYNSQIIYYGNADNGDGTASAATLSNKDSMIISAEGNDERLVLTALYDNLGKGASGAAIEILNLILGCDPTMGLDL